MTEQFPSAPTTPTPANADQRKSALAQAVSREVAAGCRVESNSDYQAVMVKGKRVNHMLHLILTLVTLSLWSWVWLALAIFGGESRLVLTVDDYGNVLRQKA